MKKILVTGAFGFIGLHLLNELNNYDLEVFTFSRSKKKLLNHFSGNFLNHETVDNVIYKIKPDILIHLAWETTPQKFYEDEINIRWEEASINLIKKFYAYGGKKFIFSGTCEEYGIKKNVNYIDEFKLCNPISLYGKSKHKVSCFLDKQFKKNSVILRNFFVCGPGENKNKLLSSIIDNAKRRNIIKLNRPFDLIDFIDVRDVAKIIAKFVVNNDHGIYNLGSSTSNTPLSLAKKILTNMKIPCNSDTIYFIEHKDVSRIISNNNKLNNTLNYKIQYTIDKTINDLIGIFDV